jgi:hypothetical protein
LFSLGGFLEENGLSKTQNDILSELEATNLCDYRGVVNRNTKAVACDQLGVNLQELAYRYPSGSELDDGSWLLDKWPPDALSQI